MCCYDCRLSYILIHFHIVSYLFYVCIHITYVFQYIYYSLFIFMLFIIIFVFTFPYLVIPCNVYLCLHLFLFVYNAIYGHYTFLVVITSLYLFTFPYMVIYIYSILPVGRCPASSSHTSLGTLPYMEGRLGLPYTLCSTT